ncbi:hypothetical protein MNBD_GAMMA22-824 [hydrothermal vent metagenome]|uniref:eCIS core domain-containing protein n=1 Tax=hydrothermal vent metagenome TaxID=652676 RepID=A0A3B1A366_9ZZZZ
MKNGISKNNRNKETNSSAPFFRVPSAAVVQQQSTPHFFESRQLSPNAKNLALAGVADNGTAQEQQAETFANNITSGASVINNRSGGLLFSGLSKVPGPVTITLVKIVKLFPDELRDEWQPEVESDLSQLRIYKNQTSANDIGARAYTFGQSMVFAPGQYQPNSTRGRQLLAHETAHALYHNDGIIRRTPGDGVDRIEVVLDQAEIIFYQNNLPYRYRLLNSSVTVGGTFQATVRQRQNRLNFQRAGIRFEFALQNDEQQGNPFTLFAASESSVSVILWGAVAAETQTADATPGSTPDSTPGSGSGLGGAGRSAENPDTPPARRGGVQISPGASDADREIVRRMMLLLHGNNENPDAPVLETYISMADIAAFRSLFLLSTEERDAIVAMLRSGRRSSDSERTVIDYASIIETSIEQRELSRFGSEFDFEFSTSGDANALVRRPVHGAIVSVNDNLVPGKEAIFEFQVRDPVDLLAVPHVFIRWVAARRDPANPTASPQVLERETTNYIEIRPDGLLNDKQFEVSFDQVGDYEIHAFVAHSFFYPAHFSIPVQVRTEADRLAEQEAAEENPFGRLDDNTSPYLFRDVFVENAIVSSAIAVASSGVPVSLLLNTDSTGTVRSGTLDSAQLDIDGQLSQLSEQIDQVAALLLRANRDNQDDLAGWAEQRLTELRQLRSRLRRNLQNQYPVAVDGYYVAAASGVRSGRLRLASWFTYDAQSQQYSVTVIDYSEMVRNQSFTFEQSGSDLARVYERIFFLLSSTYPNGRMRFSYQHYQGLVAQAEFTQFERVTDTLLNDIQETVFSQPVSIAVNVLAAVLTVFPPTTAIGIGIGLIYNGADTALTFMDATRSGTVSSSNYVDLALLAVDIIPLIGKAARLGETSLRVLRIGSEIAGLAGNLYVFNVQAFQQIDELRLGDVQRLAELQADLSVLIESHGPAEEIQRINREMQQLQSRIRSQAIRVFSEMALQQGIQILSQRGAAHFAQQVRVRTGADATQAQPQAQQDVDPETQRLLDESTTDAARPDIDEASIVQRPATASTQTGATDPVLSLGLPENLRHISVERVAGQHSSVRIVPEYGRFGIRRLRIEAGQLAIADNITSHVIALRYFQRYQGLSGAIRSASEYAVGIISGLPPDAARRARELNAEILKLPGDIEIRGNQLAAMRSELTDAQIVIQEKQLDGLREQLDGYRIELASLNATSSAVGYVAAIDTVFEGMPRRISSSLAPQQMAPARARQSIGRQLLARFMRINSGMVDESTTLSSTTIATIRERLWVLITDPVFGDLALRELSEQVGLGRVRRRSRNRIPADQSVQQFLTMLDTVEQSRRSRNESETTVEDAISAFRDRSDVPNAGTGPDTVAAGVLFLDDANGDRQQLSGVLLGTSRTIATPDVAIDPRYRRRRQSGDVETYPQAIDHAEQSVLGRAARQLERSLAGQPSAQATGELRMHVESPPCFNCLAGLPGQHAGRGPFQQFSTEFPGIRIVVTYNDGTQTARLVIQNGRIIDE